MVVETESIDVVIDGKFSLDSGALFGTTPYNVWSKYFNEKENRRIDLNAKAFIIQEDEKYYSVDSGIGDPGPYFDKWFEVRTNNGLKSYLKKMNIGVFETVFYTHLHFDHMGYLSQSSIGKSSMASIEEINELRAPSVLSQNSYVRDFKMSETTLRPFFSEYREGNFHLIKCGGHTAGSTVIFYEGRKNRIIFPGDLIPTSLHLKPNRITAIDQYPVTSYELKKDIIKKAINENFMIAFCHDPDVSLCTLNGDFENPGFQKVF
ncbi:MBL fold metallo-hydrolase [Caldiplasma sukawensis]